VLDYNILMLVHPSSGEHTFYKVKDANHIVLIDSFGNEPQKEDKKNYIPLRKQTVSLLESTYKKCLREE